MKIIKLLAILIILPLLTNSPSLAQGKSLVVKEQIESKVLDNRAKVLQAYLSKFSSPLQFHAQDFIEAADTYDLDWKLVPAIAGVESTFGKAIPGGVEQSSTSYNAWGWGVYGTQAIYFKSWREGIFTVSEGLRSNYLNKGLVDPYSINKVYASSPTWGSKVTYFLKDLDGFNTKYLYIKNNYTKLAFEVDSEEKVEYPTSLNLTTLR